MSQDLDLKLTESQEMRKAASSTFDRIYNHIFNKKATLELTAKELGVMERWEYAFKMLGNMNTPRQVVNLLIIKFGGRKSVAYDDVAKSMMLFGDPRNSNKEAKRAIAEEWIIKGIKKAWKNEDLDAYEKLISRYSKINGLDNETNTELADLLKKLRPTKITFTLTMEELKREADQLTEDVDFEDVK